MFSKNNRQMIEIKDSIQKQTYGIRKLRNGIGSVLLASSFLLAVSPLSVSAEEVTTGEETPTEVVETSEAEPDEAVTVEEVETEETGAAESDNLDATETVTEEAPVTPAEEVISPSEEQLETETISEDETTTNDVSDESLEETAETPAEDTAEEDSNDTEEVAEEADETPAELSSDLKQRETAKQELTEKGYDDVVFGDANDEEVSQLLTQIGGKDAEALKADGYTIKSGEIDGKKVLVIQGKDQDGIYYATNDVLKAVESGAALEDVDIYESPQMNIRGVIEGFYGEPWSHQARMDLFKFMSEYRMNTYIYSPKDDDYLRMKWRELYPEEELAKLKELVAAAKENHITFVYTLSPGNDIIYSSDEDYEATVAKFEQLREIGVEQFYIALDDISTRVRPEDAEKFPNRPSENYPDNTWSSLADAQAFYLNRVQNDYVKAHNLPDLWLVPTNYNGSKQDPFKEAQGEVLDPNIRIQWTGEGVFSAHITAESIENAKESYHTDHLFIWDNFPVNDAKRHRLYLTPVIGRGDDLYKVTEGFTANPMIQPYASWISIGSFGDYMWNADEYDPKQSMTEILDLIGGGDAENLHNLEIFADLNVYWDYGVAAEQEQSPMLANLLSNYYLGLMNGIDSEAYQTAKADLMSHLKELVALPETLANIPVQGFYNDSLPWLNATSNWANATLTGMDILEKLIQTPDIKGIEDEIVALGNYVAEAKKPAVPGVRTDELQIVPTIGDGFFERFVADVYASINYEMELLGSHLIPEAYQGTVTTDLPVYGNNQPGNMVDGNTDTKFWSKQNTEKGNWIRIALDEPQMIQRVVLRQGKSDTAASNSDVLTDATVYIGMEADGSDRVAIGKINGNAVNQIDLHEPMQGQYLTIEANAKTNKWLQVRELTVYGETGLTIDNIQSAHGKTAQNMFDQDIQTNYTPLLRSEDQPGVIEQVFDEPVNDAQSLLFIGRIPATVYIRNNGEWEEIGQTTRDEEIYQFDVKDKAVDGLRLVMDDVTEDDFIAEFGLSQTVLPDEPTNGSEYVKDPYVEGNDIVEIEVPNTEIDDEFGSGYVTDPYVEGDEIIEKEVPNTEINGEVGSEYVKDPYVEGDEIVEKDVTPVRVMTSDEAVDTDEVSAPVMTTEENHALPATGVSESTPWMMLGTVLSALGLGFIVRPRKKND